MITSKFVFFFVGTLASLVGAMLTELSGFEGSPGVLLFFAVVCFLGMVSCK